jgi:8-oxo-dGTP pyrophosphatase MutT (NUDIX family)
MSKKIVSYGIILFTKKENTSKFCIFQRRDTYAYSDFIQGFCFGVSAIEFASSLMTIEEKERIKEYSFDELWDDLGYQCLERKEYAKEKFLDSYEIVSRIKSSKCVKLQWGFPKGKPNKFETSKECALREFEEETCFSRNDIELWDIGPICETFQGYDGRTYETYYYIAETDRELPVKYVYYLNAIRKKTISSESLDLKWVTFEEAELLLSPRHQIILKKVLQIISQ